MGAPTAVAVINLPDGGTLTIGAARDLGIIFVGSDIGSATIAFDPGDIPGIGRLTKSAITQLVKSVFNLAIESSAIGPRLGYTDNFTGPNSFIAGADFGGIEITFGFDEGSILDFLRGDVDAADLTGVSISLDFNTRGVSFSFDRAALDGLIERISGRGENLSEIDVLEEVLKTIPPSDLQEMLDLIGPEELDALDPAIREALERLAQPQEPDTPPEVEVDPDTGDDTAEDGSSFDDVDGNGDGSGSLDDVTGGGGGNGSLDDVTGGGGGGSVDDVTGGGGGGGSVDDVTGGGGSVAPSGGGTGGGGTGGGGTGGGGTGGGGTGGPGGSWNFPRIDPIVLDLDGDGIELIGLDQSQAHFDLNANGFAERTGWVSSDDGLLAIDVNGNGAIDDIHEVFGDTDGHEHGFSNLATLDTNSDGVIDANDEAFSSLRVWQDTNENGFTDVGELRSLTEYGIESINLAYTETNIQAEGNTITEMSSLTFADGSQADVGDVNFATNPFISQFLAPEGFEYDQIAELLPQLFGRGRVPDLAIATTVDSELREDALLLLDLVSQGDISSFMSSFEAFLIEWTGATEIDPSSRGGHIDARHLHILEALHDAPFEQRGANGAVLRTDPPRNIAEDLTALYNEFLDFYAVRFIAGAASSSTLIDFANGTTDLAGLVANFESHPFSFLDESLSGYSAANQMLFGDFESIILRVVEQFDNGNLTAESAATLINSFAFDYGQEGEQFSTRISVAAQNAGLSYNNYAVAAAINFASHELVFGTVASEALSAETGQGMFIGGEGDDQLSGGEGSDIYFYSFGDGSDTITDLDYSSQTGFDTLTFSDVTAGDVSFAQGAGEDLIITLSNGETVTVANHFQENLDYAIESITFADGTTLDAQGILARLAADTSTSNTAPVAIDDFATILNNGTVLLDVLANDSDINGDVIDVSAISGAENGTAVIEAGQIRYTANEGFSGQETLSYEISDGQGGTHTASITVTVNPPATALDDQVGTSAAELYSHTTGNGSYTITDFSYGDSINDELSFMDQTLDDVTFSHGVSDNLLITTAAGEVITIIDHFRSSYYDLETITFADGTALDSQGIRDRSVSDMKSSGVVTGSELSENYVHTTGDGSYTITDFDIYGNSGTDTFVFTVSL